MVWTFLKETIGIYWIIFNTSICLIAYQCIFKRWNYFKDRNIKFERGVLLLGAHYKSFLGKQSFLDGFVELYNKFPNEKVFGFFDLGGDVKYVVRDPELIKRISIKDFDHFVNHGFDIHEESDIVFGRSLFMMKDQRWKDMRSTLSPTFTGSKMRSMFALIIETAQTFSEHLKTGGTVVEYDAKDLCCRFTNDAIASCAFGLKMNSMQDRDNEFYKKGLSFSTLDGFLGFKFFGYATFPTLMNFFRVPLFKKEDIAYFRNIILDTMEYRAKNNIVRNDMINVLIETKKGIVTADDREVDVGFAVKDAGDGKLGKTITKWTDDDLISQSMQFFIAGFNSIALNAAFALHELAVNPNVQEKLYEEVQEVQERLNEKSLNYEALQKMKYLDMFISEVLRIWPQCPANDRQVTKPYTLEVSDGTKVHLNVGDIVWSPVCGIHMDPQYFPNPEKFDPERFSDENKDKIVSGTYMPFGIGPRNCIASRFALMKAKAIIYCLVANFHIEKSSKTELPLQLKPASMNVEAKDGHWINLRIRK